MRLALTAVLLASAFGPASAAWERDGPLAQSAPGADLNLYLGFYGRQCRPWAVVGKRMDTETLWALAGGLQVSVDDQQVFKGKQGAGQALVLPEPAVAALRRGRAATVVVAGKRLGFDLSGSARAISAAQQHCRHPQPARDWITIDDDITEGWAQRAIARIRAAQASGVVLDSDGGLVYEAEKLGRWLRAQSLDTAVRSACASACVNAWAGGVDRYLAPDAKIGLHRAKARYAGYEDGQADVAAFATYLRSMGIAAAAAIAVRAAGTPSGAIDWIGAEEAQALNLATIIGVPRPAAERVAAVSPPRVVTGPLAAAAVPAPARNGAVLSLIGIAVLVGVFSGLGMAAARRPRHDAY